LPRDFDAVGGLLLTEKGLIVSFKRSVGGVEPKRWASFDVNLTNVTALIDGRVARYDLRQLYHVHRVYEEKRRRIQKLSKHKPKTAKRLMRKYSKRERNRARDLMHKLTTKIARELKELQSGAILEDLKNVKDRVLRRSKSLNRKLSKWNARQLQSMLEYKLKWLGLPVRYVSPKNSSRICPLCSGRMATYDGRLTKCGKCGFVADGDVVAVLNLRMWGSGATPKEDEPSRLIPQGRCVPKRTYVYQKLYLLNPLILPPSMLQFAPARKLLILISVFVGWEVRVMGKRDRAKLSSRMLKLQLAAGYLTYFVVIGMVTLNMFFMANWWAPLVPPSMFPVPLHIQDAIGIALLSILIALQTAFILSLYLLGKERGSEGDGEGGPRQP